MTEAQIKALASFGWQLVNSGKIAPGVAALERVVSAAPAVADYWTAYGIGLAKADKHRPAIVALERSLALRADNLEVLCVVGELKLGVADYRGAAAALKRCLELDPDGIARAGIRARALIRKGQKQLEAAMT